MAFIPGGPPIRHVGVCTTEMVFVPGSIAANLASSDARTFKPPPDNWVPAGSNDPATFFAGSADTLTGDLIREGVTGVAGQVAEPYVLGAVRPEILFPAYLAGFNLAEAFYLATPTLSWTTIVVGDPLCRPFAGRILTSADLESAIDATHRTASPVLGATGGAPRRRRHSPACLKAAVVPRSAPDTLIARGDRAGAREALEQAVKAAPAATGLLLALAQLEEADAAYDTSDHTLSTDHRASAGERHALNNLAYSLAVRRNLPAEALPLAKRAAALAPRSAERPRYVGVDRAPGGQ